MPGNTRRDWHGRLKAVEAEFTVAGLAVAAYRLEFAAGRVSLPHPLKGRDLNRTAEQLPVTYAVRLFAVFEAALRSYWLTLGRDTQPPATDLMNGVAAHRNVPPEVLTTAHAVREERNQSVHHSAATALTLPEARHRLQLFLARLPDEW